jgi:hypothetical protein
MNSEPKDPSEEYDAKHGKTTDAETQRPSGLTEAKNKAAECCNPFKNLSKE